MRVVLDTSVIVSGLISARGAAAAILLCWINNEFQLLYSAKILEEYQDVLGRAWVSTRLKSTPNHIDTFLRSIVTLGEPIIGYVNVAGKIRDPFDEIILMCAQLGQADYIVSLDKDLLTLGAFEQAQIVTPGQFLQILRHGKAE